MESPPIERVLEIDDRPEPDYQGFTVTPELLAQGYHRTFVGGLWDEIGALQLDFLVKQGLKPGHKFLDVGCGSLRAGRVLIDYLEPGNYYGIDINHSLLETGYAHELSEAQRERLQGGHLRSTDRFDGDFGVQFDMAIAQSVFTHVSLNHVRLALYRVAKVMKPGGQFFATFFERRGGYPVDGAKRKYTERNPFWYYRGDLRWAAKRSPWKVTYIGDWDHPRNQKMMCYTRADDSLPQ